MGRKLTVTGLAAALAIVIAGCSNESVDHSTMGHEEPQEEKEQTIQAEVNEDGEKVFDLRVEETHWMFNDEVMDDAWTYNGSLPGEEIRVQEGDKVLVNVENALDEPTALHLHGFPVPNEMDGVPGITQNAIMPGETFTYEYQADIPGTYWYHSHQDGARQVDKGLYGVFIVEPNDGETYDVDEVVVIDEWSSMGMGDMNHGSMDHGSMDHGKMNNEEMDHGGMNDGGMTHAEMMNQMYDTPLINGKTAPQIEAVQVEEGDKVKLRFVNAGLFTQVVSIPDHSFKITHYDGQPVNEPETINDTSFRIAPAERYDIEIEMENPGAWGIQIFAEENQKRLEAIVPVIYEGYEERDLQSSETSTSFFDMTSYGESKEVDYGTVTKEYDMILGTNDNGETFTINDKQFPDHESYEVEEGDVVKLTIVNDTDVDHPMHLHGEFFSVMSKDGSPISGSPIVKDTLNVRPGEEYEIVFEAKNPGIWMFHCHEFHHANAGMMAEVRYKGYEPDFTLDPSVPNKPE
ncbi:multicopper oxidase family protein [Alkalihalophilus lindianensis]|uniref:Multicopper oxidase family protein n=1 Tax=Alkalihalophilus lindianensis TaxID=1630542 RepID=A0ABU3XEY5_9BACI|nr:multicopper oxidase family protein [Alkalihalophilus lindianensis]MDV2686439.1 multicopper oxidase family protein [Alkalihalophilus lindianensis]